MKTDVIIIGSGLAGMTVALSLPAEKKVLLISKAALLSGSTPLAQGGIAVSTEKDIEEHIADTLRVGAGKGKPQAVRILIEESKAAIKFLQEQGVQFSESLHQEAGHSKARIMHIDDKTGWYLARTLQEKVREADNITLLENATVFELLKREDGSVGGAALFQEGEEKIYEAEAVVLATGGGEEIYKRSTASKLNTGDGFILAVEVGAKLKGLHYVQFHPTVLEGAHSPALLLSEALRGEGAQIVNEKGEQLCDPLLPRDIMARSIFEESSAGRKVFLSLRKQAETFWRERFPQVIENITKEGYKIHDLLPIAPAAHFFCGGVKTDLWGQTNVSGLFAVGEVACTGVHGANRLASNSLLECVVFGRRAAAEILKQEQEGNSPFLSKRRAYVKSIQGDQDIKKEIQETCDMHLGIIRSREGLEAGLKKLEGITPKSTELQFLHKTALLTLQAALEAKESVGCHYRAECSSFYRQRKY